MKSVVSLACVSLLLSNCIAAAQGKPESAVQLNQEHAGHDVAIVQADAPVFLMPDGARQPLRVAKAGSRLDLYEQNGDWCAVGFNDPQYGPRRGYIQSKFVTVQSPTLEPMDLSMPASTRLAAPTAVAPEHRQQQEPSRHSRPMPVSRGSATPSRGWIDVDFGHYRSRQDALTLTATAPKFQETAAFGAGYPKLAPVNDIDLSGGVGLGNGAGVDVHITAAKYSSPVALAVSVPSPYFFNTSGTAANVTDTPLDRNEYAIDFAAQYAWPATSRITLRAFGGPTLFHVNDHMIDAIGYSQFASPLLRLNLVAVTSYTQKEVSGSALGWNIGGDGAFFLARHVGVGAGLRFNQGKVRVTDPLTQHDTDLQMGHFEVAAGLRLRF